jgi:hypothetical protein
MPKSYYICNFNGSVRKLLDRCKDYKYLVLLIIWMKLTISFSESKQLVRLRSYITDSSSSRCLKDLLKFSSLIFDRLVHDKFKYVI